MRAFGAYHLHRLHGYLHALPCVLDYEHFHLCLCSGDGYSDVLAVYGSRVVVVGGSITGCCVAFAMHTMHAGRAGFSSSGCLGSRRDRRESVVIPEGLTVLFTQTSGSLGTAREVQCLARMLLRGVFWSPRWPRVLRRRGLGVAGSPGVRLTGVLSHQFGACIGGYG